MLPACPYLCSPPDDCSLGFGVGTEIIKIGFSGPTPFEVSVAKEGRRAMVLWWSFGSAGIYCELE